MITIEMMGSKVLLTWDASHFPQQGGGLKRGETFLS